MTKYQDDSTPAFQEISLRSGEVLSFPLECPELHARLSRAVVHPALN